MIYDNTTGELKPLAGSPASRLQAIEDNIAVNENVYGAKNLIPYPYTYTNGNNTINGVTFTVNDDGSVIANGTATDTTYFTLWARRGADTTVDRFMIPNGNYILNGCVGGSDSTYHIQVGVTIGGTFVKLGEYCYDGEDVEFTVNGDDYSVTEAALQVQICVRNGQTVDNVVFRPMVRAKGVIDNTFEPYIPSNKQITNEIKNVYKVNGILGAKNFLPYPYYDTTKTINGITFTDNKDGTVTVSGTATELAQFTVFPRNANGNFKLPKGEYILSGCPEGGALDKYYINFSFSNQTYTGRDIGDGGKINVTNTYAQEYFGLFITIPSGSVISTPITFKPMIRLAQDTDDTYVPYAPTNAKLNEEKMSYADNGVLGAKNLLPNTATTQTVNGITFTVNADGSITANGTATGDDYTAFIDFATNVPIKKGTYIFDGLTGGDSATYSAYVLIDGTYHTIIDNPLTISVSQDTVITRARFLVRKSQTVSNVTFKPMIRLASDPDNTYESYAKTNQQLTAENKALTNNINVNGSKNVLASLTPSGTYLGITISRNESGDIIVNGTATASPTTISLFDRTFKHIGEATILKFTDLGIDKTKKYVFSRAEKVSNFRYNIRVMNGTTQVAEIELGNDDGLYTVIDFSQYTCDGLKADIVVANETTITNKVFSAMLCLESDYDLDPTYQPYAMTNKELTDKAIKSGTITSGINTNGYLNETLQQSVNVISVISQNNSQTARFVVSDDGGRYAIQILNGTSNTPVTSGTATVIYYYI